MILIKTLIKIILLYIIIIFITPNLWLFLDKKLDIKINKKIINIRNSIQKNIYYEWSLFKKWANNPTPKMRNKLNQENKDIKNIENN